MTGNYSFKLSTENIEIVISYKYLGVLFNCNGRFRKRELELHQQAQRAMYSLVGLCRKFDLSVGMQLELFHTMVLSVMTYAVEVWGNYVIREFSQLQMKFLKHTLYTCEIE